MAKYFKNVKSIEDLKSQFRKLAIAHHPDRGGDVEVMKMINIEYDALFPIWKDRHEQKTGEWINTMSQKGLCASTIKQVAASAQKVFTYIVNEGYVQKNPFKSVKYNGKKSKQKRELTDEEIKIFYEFAEIRMPVLCPVITLLLNTGLRIGELIAVTWNDLSDDGKYLTINKTRTKYKDNNNNHVEAISTPKTEESNRTIPLVDTAYKCIHELKIKQKEYYGTGWNSDMTIIQSKQHKAYTMSNIESAFYNLNKKIKKENKDFISITPHYFRHTFASKAIRSNIPSLYIQYMCGWANASMLNKVYGHVTPAQIMELVNNIDVNSSLVN